jgi:hypothetical protein
MIQRGAMTPQKGLPFHIPLNRGAEGAVDDELGQHANGARHTKQDRVVVGLGQAVVLQQDTRVRVDVGERVLGLAVLLEHLGRNLVDLADELEHGVLRHVGCERKPESAGTHTTDTVQ